MEVEKPFKNLWRDWSTVIVSIRLYSASCSAHQSDTLPEWDTQREESSATLEWVFLSSFSYCSRQHHSFTSDDKIKSVYRLSVCFCCCQSFKILSVCLLAACLSVCLSVCQLVCLAVSLSVGLCCQSVCVRQSVCVQSVCAVFVLSLFVS